TPGPSVGRSGPRRQPCRARMRHSARSGRGPGRSGRRRSAHRVAAASRPRPGPLFLRLVQERDVSAGLLELALGLVELLLESLALLLGSQGALFPALSAGTEVPAANLLFLEFALTAGGLGLPLVPAFDQLGDQNAGRATERGGRIM